MAKKQRWKKIKVSNSSIKARFFNFKDVRAFEQGNLSAEDLLNSEQIPQELAVHIPPEYREFLKNSVKNLKSSGARCMYPSCQEPPIKAHMLSKASWLGVLSEEGNNVLKIDEDITGVFLGKIPVDRASTESCFCSKHDNDLFQLLDASEASVKTEWFFKLAYRLLCGTILPTENFLDRFELNLPDEASPLNLILGRQQDARKECLHVKKLMDDALLKEDWSIIESRHWKIPTEKPTVAAAGIRTLDDVCQKGKNDDCHVFVSAIPRQTETLVVISSIKKDSEIIKNYLKRIGIYGKSGQDPKICPALSKLLLKYCKYICFRPSFVETKSNREWEDILTYWRLTDLNMLYDIEHKENETFNLFVE